jgi:hypothetical protein
MGVDLLAVRDVGVQVVRVVRERRDAEPARPQQVADGGRAGGVEALGVDVRDARVAALLAAAGRRPARA